MAKVLKSEAEVYGALRRRFSAPEYAVLPGVADQTGYGKSRTIDAIIMSLWPSRGLLIHGVEIKVSRADWLRELSNPDKQEAIFSKCDRFWLAVGDVNIVNDDEIPATWGLLVPSGTKMRVKKEAPELSPNHIDRGFLAAILRKVDSTSRDPELEARIREQLEAEYEVKIKRAGDDATVMKDMRIRELEKELENARAFAEKSGISFESWSYSDRDSEVKIIRKLSRAGQAHFVANTLETFENLKTHVDGISSKLSSVMNTIKDSEVGNEA